MFTETVQPSKNAKHIRFYQQQFCTVCSRVSLTRIGQISNFSSLSFWIYIQHAMVQKQVHLIVNKNRQVPTDWGGFTTPNLTSFELFRSIFNTIPVYWQNTVGTKTFLSLATTMYLKASITAYYF